MYYWRIPIEGAAETACMEFKSRHQTLRPTSLWWAGMFSVHKVTLVCVDNKHWHFLHAPYVTLYMKTNESFMDHCYIVNIRKRPKRQIIRVYPSVTGQHRGVQPGGNPQTHKCAAGIKPTDATRQPCCLLFIKIPWLDLLMRTKWIVYETIEENVLTDHCHHLSVNRKK